MAGRWSFLVAETDGTPICGLPNARNRNLTWSLTDPPKLTFETDSHAFEASKLVELETDVLAYRDGALMFRGRVGPTQDTLDGTTATTSWTVIGYAGVLACRIVWPSFTTSWTGTDQALIAKSLIDATQSLTDGDLGIDASGLTATGITRDYTVDPGKPINETIDALAGMINGFDWAIEPDMTAHIWYPARGSTVAWSAVYGQTMRTFQRTTVTSDYASDLLGVGGDGTTPHTASSTPRTRGRWERSQSWSDVTVQSTLNAHTDGQLILNDWLPSVSFTVDPDRWTPANAWLGDTIGIHVHDGRVDLDTTARIVEIGIAIDDSDIETITPTVNRTVTATASRLSALAGRVGNLERR